LRILVITAFAGACTIGSAAPQASASPAPDVGAASANTASTNAASAGADLAKAASADAASAAAAAAAAAAEKAAAKPAPPDPSLVCKSGIAADKAFSAAIKLSPSIPQTRLASRLKFLPLDSETDILAFIPPDPKTRFRIILAPEDEPGNQSTRMIDFDQVSAEAATSGTAGTDFKQLEDKSPKTVIRFAPVLDDPWVFWKTTRVYVIGCIDGDVAQQYGQFQTSITNKWFCRALAVLMCVAFYVLAAYATFYIHRSQRVYSDQKDLAKHGLNGTNYASLWHHFNPVVLTAGSNGRGNATKLQILFFSLVVFGLVSYIWMSTGYLSDLSSTVLLLMGISGFGATVSAATDVAKTRLDFDNWAWLINRGWLPKGGVAEANRAQWKDIVMTDGEFDVYRFQMITFSVLVGMALLGAGGKMADLSTFTIPGALLGILGLSQVVYVAGKLVAPPSVSQLNDQILKLRGAESALQTALTRQDQATTAVGATVLPLDRAELAARVGDLYEKYIEAWETTRTMFESTLSREVSAVAEGHRPPFPYLSAPAEVMAVLEVRFAEVDKKLTELKAKLNTQAALDASDLTKIGAIDTARAAFVTALEFARRSLEIFRQNVDKSMDDSEGISAGIANERAKAKAKSESDARIALDVVRQRIDQLNQLLLK
jgi:hypothetical protein